MMAYLLQFFMKHEATETATLSRRAFLESPGNFSGPKAILCAKCLPSGKDSVFVDFESQALKSNVYYTSWTGFPFKILMPSVTN